MKKVTFEDLYSFTYLSDIAVSPDEQKLVFSRHMADEKTNGYKSCLWLMDAETGAHHQLTFGGGERGAKYAVVLRTLNREASPLKCTVAESRSMGIGEQSQGKDSC